MQCRVSSASLNLFVPASAIKIIGKPQEATRRKHIYYANRKFSNTQLVDVFALVHAIFPVTMLWYEMTVQAKARRKAITSEGEIGPPSYSIQDHEITLHLQGSQIVSITASSGRDAATPCYRPFMSLWTHRSFDGSRADTLLVFYIQGGRVYSCTLF